MRILIDMQGIQTAQGAENDASSHSRALSIAMMQNPGQCEISILLNAQLPESFLDFRRTALNYVPHNRIFAWQGPVPQSRESQSTAWRSAMADVLRSDVIAAAQPDILHSSFISGIADDAAFSLGGRLPKGIFVSDPTLIDDAEISQLNRARLVLTTSEFAKWEIVKRLGISSELVVDIGIGVGERFFAPLVGLDEEKSIREQYGLPRPFVLYRGGFDAHDNVGTLIEAFAIAKQSLPQPYDLVLVGSVGHSERRALGQLAEQRGILIESLKWLDTITDQGLLDLLRICSVFAYPSLHEYSGLPVLEAMAAGAQVLCSDLGALPEIISDPDILFDARRPESIARSLVGVLSGTRVGPSAPQTQLHARRFTCSSWARRATEAYQSLHMELKPRSSQIILPPLGKLVRTLAGRAPPTLRTSEISALAAAIIANRPSCSPPRLLLDATVQCLNNPSGGIGRVVDRITVELLKQPPQGLAVMPVRIDDNPLQFRLARRYQASLLGENFDGEEELVELRRGDHFLALDLNHAIDRRTAFFDRVRRVGGRLSAVVYDLLPLQRPDWFPARLAKRHDRWFDVVSQFDDLVCISRTVADDVALELQRRMPKHIHPQVSWFHLGCELPVTPNGKLPEQLSQRPTVLLVSSLWLRKGHEQALNAFEELWGAGCDVNLVFAGHVGWGVDKLVNRLVGHPEDGKRLFWFNGPDDGLLGQLYANCTGVLVASEGEGFGLPVVEALAYKRPVLARELPIFKEIAGDRITYFRADTSSQLAEALRDWITAVSCGMPSDDFPAPLSWSQSTIQLLTALGLKQA